jgi:hypothetical protein
VNAITTAPAAAVSHDHIHHLMLLCSHMCVCLFTAAADTAAAADIVPTSNTVRMPLCMFTA